MQIITFTYLIPEDYRDEGETAEETLKALKNGNLKVDDLQFLADDRESDVTVSITVEDR